MRNCNECKREFEEPRPGRPGQFYSVCKTCRNKYACLSKHRLRIQVYMHYCGGEPRCMCEGCNVTDVEFLTIDHIGGGGAAHRREMSQGQRIANWLKSNGYPDGYRVLCMNCNLSLGAYGYCPHNSARRLPKLEEIRPQKSPKGESNPNATLTSEIAIEIVRLASTGMSNKMISEALNVKRYNVRNVRKGITWNHVTKISPVAANLRRD